MKQTLNVRANKFDEPQPKVISVIAMPASCANAHSVTSEIHLLLEPYDNDKPTRSDESAQKIETLLYCAWLKSQCRQDGVCACLCLTRRSSSPSLSTRFGCRAVSFFYQLPRFFTNFFVIEFYELRDGCDRLVAILRRVCSNFISIELSNTNNK